MVSSPGTARASLGKKKGVGLVPGHSVTGKAFGENCTDRRAEHSHPVEEQAAVVKVLNSRRVLMELGCSV